MDRVGCPLDPQWYAGRMASERTDVLSPAMQVAAHIRGLVAGGFLHPGEKLPSSRDLAAELGVAKGTILAAYTSLRESGAVRAVWNGYVVADTQAVQTADDLALTREVRGFVERLLLQGFSRTKIREALERCMEGVSE